MLDSLYSVEPLKLFYVQPDKSSVAPDRVKTN